MALTPDIESRDPLAGCLIERVHASDTDVLGRYRFVLDRMGNRTLVTETLMQPAQTVTVTQVYTVSASSDDATGYWDPTWPASGWVELDQSSIEMGTTLEENAARGGYRFDGVEFPAGAELLDAELRLTAEMMPAGTASASAMTSAVLDSSMVAGRRWRTTWSAGWL